MMRVTGSGKGEEAQEAYEDYEELKKQGGKQWKLGWQELKAYTTGCWFGRCRPRLFRE